MTDIWSSLCLAVEILNKVYTYRIHFCEFLVLPFTSFFFVCTFHVSEQKKIILVPDGTVYANRSPDGIHTLTAAVTPGKIATAHV